MHWTNGSRKPTRRTPEFLQHTNCHLCQFLPLPWIHIFYTTFSARLKAISQVKRYDRGNPHSTLFARCLQNGLPGMRQSVSSWRTNTNPEKATTVIPWFAIITDGQRNQSWKLQMAIKSAARITAGDMLQTRKPHCVLTGGIRPAAIVDEKNTPYHWCPSFYRRIDGSNIHGSVKSDSYIAVSINTIQHTRRHSHLEVRPFIFHGVAKCRQEQHLRIPTGGVPAEYTASLYYDVIHGHDKRWLVRSHLSTLMGFSEWFSTFHYTKMIPSDPFHDFHWTLRSSMKKFTVLRFVDSWG